MLPAARAAFICQMLRVESIRQTTRKYYSTYYLTWRQHFFFFSRVLKLQIARSPFFLGGGEWKYDKTHTKTLYYILPRHSTWIFLRSIRVRLPWKYEKTHTKTLCYILPPHSTWFFLRSIRVRLPWKYDKTHTKTLCYILPRHSTWFFLRSIRVRLPWYWGSPLACTRPGVRSYLNYEDCWVIFFSILYIVSLQRQDRKKSVFCCIIRND